TTSRRARRFRSRSSAPKARSKMPARTALGQPSNYLVALVAVTRNSTAQLVRAPSHARRAQAARRLARHTLLTCAIGAAAVIALMFVLDGWEIGVMPLRGTPDLWPVRILTDFGKDAYVLWSLAGALVIVAFASAGRGGASRAKLLRLGTRLHFLFFVVLVFVLGRGLVKWTAG